MDGHSEHLEFNVSDRVSYKNKNGTVKRNRVFGSKHCCSIHVIWDDKTQSILQKVDLKDVVKI
jgi:hypothetical protein